MNNSSKKHVSSVSNYLVNSKRFFSILTMVLIITSTLSTVVCSQGTFLNTLLNNNENQISSESEIITTKDTLINERLSSFEEKITSLQDRFTSSTDSNDEIDIENDISFREIEIKSSNSPLLRAFDRLFRLNLLNLTIMFYTNYSGLEKETSIKFLQTKKIDINDDGKKDIKVKLGLSFSIVRFLHFSINFKFLITRLADFPDATAHFEAYSEIYLPGLLSLKQKGDRIRLGYESPEGEVVPSSCQIIYRYLPNILFIRKNPEHRLEINPGKNTNNSKLILLLSYTNFNNNKTILSELKSRVIYNPAVKSSISFGGKGIFGGINYEFKKDLSKESLVDMYVSFEKNNKTTIGYVKDLPKKVTLKIGLGIDGCIKFNTYNHAPSEIGLVDDFYNPQNKVFFADLLSKAELIWNSRLLLLQKVDVDFYTDTPGTYLKGDFKIFNNTTANLSVSSKENLDCKMTLNLKNGSFVFERNKVDISIDVLLNKTNASLDFSTNISSFYDKPFEIFFDKLFDGNVEVLFSGAYLEISDFNLTFLKSATNSTKGNNKGSSEELESTLTLSLSSLCLNSRDFIKIIKDNNENNFNITAGTNGSIILKDFIIESKILQAQLELFEIASDHLYGTVINVSISLSNISKTSIESFSLENCICRFIIEGFSIKLNYMDLIKIDEFRTNFSGNGVLYLTYSNSSINLNGAITGPGLFELVAARVNFTSNQTNLLKLIIEDFNISGPTTFFIIGSVEFNQSKIADYDFSAGVNTNLHLGKLYLEALLPLIEIINLNGAGQVSGGAEKCPYDGLFDIVVTMSGTLYWDKFYFVPLSEEIQRPGLHSGSIFGNVSFKIHVPTNLKKIGTGHMSINVYSTTKLDQFKIEIGNWSISGFSFNMEPGTINLSWIDILSSPNLHFLIDNSDTINLEFDNILFENKETGATFSFKSREIMVPHLEIMTNLNGDGDGFLFLDSDNQYCNFEITRSNLIIINKTFRANNFNISWNFSGGLFNILDTKGFIEFGAEFVVKIFFNSKWRILISINQPTAEFTWTPTEPQINETIQFDGSDSYYTAPITRYDWKWNSTDVWHNNLGAYPTHSYIENGSYKVTLRVWSGLKQSSCSKIVEVGEGNRSLNIFCEEETILENIPFNIIILDIDDTPMQGELVTYAQQDSNGNWQFATNITNSEGLVGFTAFDVPYDSINYCDAKIYVNESGYFDEDCKWFQVYDSTIYSN